MLSIVVLGPSLTLEMVVGALCWLLGMCMLVTTLIIPIGVCCYVEKRGAITT